MERDETIIERAGGALTRRRMIAGGAGVGVAALAGVTLAYAQSASPSPSGDTFGTSGQATPSAGTSQSTSNAQEMAAQAYQTFVSNLTTNLGLTDTAATDQAIRTSLSQEVDALLSEGHISQDEATALKQRITSDDVPLPIGLGWRAWRDERGGRRGSDGPGAMGGGPGGFGGPRGGDGTSPGTSSSPSASASSSTTTTTTTLPNITSSASPSASPSS